MIDEKKLIDTLRTYYDKVLHQNISDDEKLAKHDMLSDVMIEIKGQPKIGGWIPCSERLPENGKKVLVSRNGKTLEEIFKFQLPDEEELEDYKKEFGCKNDIIGYFITKNGVVIGLYSDDTDNNAWQPLPEAYHG